jgi:hypothetical protein
MSASNDRSKKDNLAFSFIGTAKRPPDSANAP